MDQKPVEKRVVSNILVEPRNWQDAKKVKPGLGELVVIRMMNPNVLYGENDTEIYPAEDMKLAKWIPGQKNPDDGTWVIEPPYPLFDFSPLSNKDALNEDTIVTHWAVPEEGEIEGWKTRFDQTYIYKTLKLEVDGDHIKDVYRALVWGSAFIANNNPGDPDARKLANILYDLQYVLDTGKGIDLTDEEYEQALAEYAAKKKAEEEAAIKEQTKRVDHYVDTHPEKQTAQAEDEGE